MIKLLAPRDKLSKLLGILIIILIFLIFVLVKNYYNVEVLNFRDKNVNSNQKIISEDRLNEKGDYKNDMMNDSIKTKVFFTEKLEEEGRKDNLLTGKRRENKDKNKRSRKVSNSRNRNLIKKELNTKLMTKKIDKINLRLRNQTLNKLRTALLLYIFDYQSYPEKLSDLVGEYLLEMPIETRSGIDRVSNRLDFSGGWYYNPNKINYANLLTSIKESLMPNNSLDYIDEVEFTPYKIHINKKEGKLYLMKGNRKDKSYTIAIGSSTSPTPTGEFRVKEKVELTKEQWKDYGHYWIGLALWTKGGSYGIHGSNDKLEITEQKSKGCIRMKEDDLEELYHRIPLRTRVVIE